MISERRRAIPPLCVPQYRSHAHASSATCRAGGDRRCAASTASTEAHTRAEDEERPPPRGTRPSTTTSIPVAQKDAPTDAQWSAAPL